MKKKAELLNEKNTTSMMRWTLLQVVIMSYMFSIGIVVYIGYSGYNGSEIDWSGVALFLGGMAAFLGAAVTGKWLQKKEEDNGEK